MNPASLNTPNTPQHLVKALRERAHQKRVELKSYARGIERRTARRNTISVVCSALAAVLATSGVTLGQAFGPPASPIWKTLCVLSAICSAITAICINLVRSSASPESIEKAHRAESKLENLELQLEFGQISPDQGLELYLQVMADMPGPAIPLQPLTELISDSRKKTASPPQSPAQVP